MRQRRRGEVQGPGAMARFQFGRLVPGCLSDNGRRSSQVLLAAPLPVCLRTLIIWGGW